MKYSAGLVVIKNNKILLCHPTNSSWRGSFSIPKGIIEEGESILETAIRETKEETGLDIPKSMIDPTKYTVDYKKENKIYKRVYYYVANINKLNMPEILPKGQLQLEEIDYAKFFTKEEAKKIILNRISSVLQHLK